MIVNSFPSVPRMDHILYEYDRYLSFRFLRRIQYSLLLYGFIPGRYYYVDCACARYDGDVSFGLLGSSSDS